MTRIDTATPSMSPLIIVVLPSGTRRAEPLCAAIAAQHPSWEIAVVWAGDPYLRPVLTNGWEWREPAAGSVVEIDYVRTASSELAWLIGLSVVQAAQLQGRHCVLMIAGAVAVLGNVEALLPLHDDALRFVPRLTSPLSEDGVAPDLDDLEEAGLYSTSVAAFGPDAQAGVTWLGERLRDDEPLEIGRLLELAHHWFVVESCADEAVGVSIWRWHVGTPALIDAVDFDPAQPWVLDAASDSVNRVSLNDPERLIAMKLAAPQFVGSTESIRLPGALQPDKAIRLLARESAEVPMPWSNSHAFREWVDSKYWNRLVQRRPDLEALFPHHQGRDADAFARWAAAAATQGHVPFMISPPAASQHRFERESQRTDGVDIVGYLGHRSGIGSIGRQMTSLLESAGVPHTALGYRRSPSPLVEPAPRLDHAARFATTLGFVNGDQFALMRGDHPELFPPGGRSIGYWFWELSTLRGGPPVATSHVDEIWVSTRFVARAFEELGQAPVRVVPIPHRQPIASNRPRDAFAPLATSGDRFVFGVVLDHLSVTERKNPVAAIRAFRDAFSPDEGPILIVKTLNAEQRWQQHQRLLVEAACRSDIIIWDTHLSLGDHMALVASFDCLVSLHRSEGLGLHLAEAMWLDVPVIATRYSGNLDFMDDSCSLLIDAEQVNVTGGEGAYPDTATWADPDHEMSVTAMRKMASDSEFAHRLATAGRARMEAQPTQAAFVAEVVRLLELTGQ